MGYVRHISYPPPSEYEILRPQAVSCRHPVRYVSRVRQTKVRHDTTCMYQVRGTQHRKAITMSTNVRH